VLVFLLPAANHPRCPLFHTYVLVPFDVCFASLSAQLYPVRVRVVNVIGQAQWVTAAYVPIVRRLKERSADARARLRRSGVLQRTLYAAFREYIAFSHLGFAFKLGTRTLKVCPRTLLYLCDRPEERAVFCQIGGQCEYPCSVCTVRVGVSGAATAVNSQERKAIDVLEDQVEAMELVRSSRRRSRRVTLEEGASNSSYAPVFGATAGLGTDPHLLFHMVGFGILHVRLVRCIIVGRGAPGVSKGTNCYQFDTMKNFLGLQFSPSCSICRSLR